MTENQPGHEFGSGLRQIAMVVELLQHSGAENVDALAPLLHPQMRMLAAPGVAPMRRYQTSEDFLRYFSEARANGVLVQPDVRELRVHPSGAVMAVGSLRMTSRGSVDETPAWFVYTFRDGLIASLETHLSAELAANAVARAGTPSSQGT